MVPCVGAGVGWSVEDKGMYIAIFLPAFLTESTFLKFQSWYLEKRSNSKGSVVEISKIQSVCLDKNTEDRLLYLMMGPGLPVFYDH